MGSSAAALGDEPDARISVETDCARRLSWASNKGHAMSLITRDFLETGYRKGRWGISTQWGIKMHLSEDPMLYTKDARNFLVEIAREKGISDQEIERQIKRGITVASRKRSRWYPFLIGLGVIGVVAISIGFLLLQDYSVYEELSRHGVKSDCVIVDQESYSRIHRGRKRKTKLITFVCGGKNVRRANLPDSILETGEVLPVFYVPDSKGCLVFAQPGSALNLLIHRFKNGACFRIRNDLEEKYVSQVRD